MRAMVGKNNDDWTIHLTPFYLETGNCHGKVGVRVRVNVWVRVGVKVMVWVRIN